MLILCNPHLPWAMPPLSQWHLVGAVSHTDIGLRSSNQCISSAIASTNFAFYLCITWSHALPDNACHGAQWLQMGCAIRFSILCQIDLHTLSIGIPHLSSHFGYLLGPWLIGAYVPKPRPCQCCHTSTGHSVVIFVLSNDSVISREFHSEPCLRASVVQAFQCPNPCWWLNFPA